MFLSGQLSENAIAFYSNQVGNAGRSDAIIGFCKELKTEAVTVIIF
jgi:hypothetical protein